jgi:hypothetical protein
MDKENFESHFLSMSLISVWCDKKFEITHLKLIECSLIMLENFRMDLDHVCRTARVS